MSEKMSENTPDRMPERIVYKIQIACKKRYLSTCGNECQTDCQIEYAGLGYMGVPAGTPVKLVWYANGWAGVRLTPFGERVWLPPWALGM